jgi:HEPN domain-containing protein/predicted nucleotidyltransferase
MIQAPAESIEVLQAILERIVTELGPRRVYLFGSRARGDARAESDYDLMIEVEHGDTGEQVALEKLRAVFHDRGYRIDAHLRARDRIEQRMNDPGTTDWDVVREGRLLYSLPDLPRLAPEDPHRVREPKPESPQSLSEWLRYARLDLFRARHEMEDYLEDWSNEVCFFSHQGAEKMLKALLVARNQRPERTHNLKVLATRIRLLGVALDNIDAECELLTPHAVEPRYPGGGRTRLEARDAVEAAERIAAAVRAHLP